MVLVAFPRQIYCFLPGSYRSTTSIPDSRSVALHYTLAPTTPPARAVRFSVRQVRVRLTGEAEGELVFRGDPQSAHPPPVLEKFSEASAEEQPAEYTDAKFRFPSQTLAQHNVSRGS